MDSIRGKLLLIGGIMAVIVAAAILLYNPPLALESTAPRSGATAATLTPTITFTFNKALQADQTVEYDTDPAINATVHVDGKSVLLIPQHQLLEDRAYTVTLARVQGASGAVLQEVSLDFTTGLDQSPRAQFIRRLPVYFDGFNISYTPNLDMFVVQITKQPIEEHRKQARQYLLDNGIDLNINRVEFDVLRSLQGRGAPAG